MLSNRATDWLELTRHVSVGVVIEISIPPGKPYAEGGWSMLGYISSLHCTFLAQWRVIDTDPWESLMCKLVISRCWLLVTG